MTEPAPQLKPVARGQNEQFQFFPIEWLRPSKTNPRKHFADLAELVESVHKHGVLVPLIVRALSPKTPGDTLYEIVAGERRYRASKEAKLPELPVRVLELDDKQTLELQLIENLQRADVHPIEEADGYQRLIDKHGYNAAGLAVRVGKSESYVYQRLKLATLIPKAKEAFYDEKLTASHAILIARLDEKQQKQALEYAAGSRHHQPSVREFEEWVHEEFYLDLHAAPWKKDDAELVPAAGACLACPKRSGFLPALFPELSKGKDLCQDAGCYRGKHVAFIKRSLAEDPELKPIAVGYLDTAEAKSLQREHGTFQRVDTWDVKRDKKKPSGAVRGIVLGGHGARTGETVWFVKKKPSAGDSALEKRYKAERRRAELVQERKIFAREKLGAAILAAVPPAPAERELRIVAKAFFKDVWHELKKRIATRHGIKPPKPADLEKLMGARIDTWGQSELSPFLIEVALSRHLQVHSYDRGEPDDLIAAAQAYKLNGKAILAAGAAECQRLQKAKEERKKKKPAVAKAAKKKAAKTPARKAKKNGARALAGTAADIVHQLHTNAAKKGGASAPKAKAAAATA
jgi:ParB family chromosome partitioning protein